MTSSLSLASCTVVTSPEVAFRAGRTFFWRKWRTKSGALLLGAILINIATLIGVTVWIGPDNWLVGVVSAILFLNCVLQGGYFLSLPRALRRAALRATQTTSEIEVTDDGVTVRSGKNTHHLPWKVFSFIWIYDDFILLPLGKVVLNRFVWVPTSGMTPEVLTAFRTARSRPAIQ
jgi:hypothetical protein